MTEADSLAPLRREELSSLFVRAEVPQGKLRLGAESEKFGVHRKSARPLAYDGEFGVERVFCHLRDRHGWQAAREVRDGPIIALERGNANITLEPGGQFELSGEALEDLHAVAEEQSEHFAELASITEEMQIAWLTTGFHPTARQADLPWVPKQRYPIMREYLPTKGSGAHDMMRRTATVQLNLDWRDERDGMRKLLVGLKLSPIINALFANSPFAEGQPTGLVSRRGKVWLHMDPARSGLIEALWNLPAPRYEDYVEWALDAGMFFFRRGDQLHLNTGQTFRDFLNNGYQGHRATWNDWELHVKTLFPEVRLKSTLEVRPVDSLPPDLGLASMALWVGLLYDSRSLDLTEALVAEFDHRQMEELRPALIERGLLGPVFGWDGFELAEKLLEFARAGLDRRARALEMPTEAGFLHPIERLVEGRQHPADVAMQRAKETGSVIAATALPASL